jgi:hypothetical protein
LFPVVYSDLDAVFTSVTLASLILYTYQHNKMREGGIKGGRKGKKEGRKDGGRMGGRAKGREGRGKRHMSKATQLLNGTGRNRIKTPVP